MITNEYLINMCKLLDRAEELIEWASEEVGACDFKLWLKDYEEFKKEFE